MSEKLHSFSYGMPMRTILIPLLLCVAAIGCDVPTQPRVSPDKPDKPIVAVDNIWTNLADCIDAGECCDSDKLELMVRHLRSVKKITDADVAKIHDALKKLGTENWVLTADDSNKIRSL